MPATDPATTRAESAATSTRAVERALDLLAEVCAEGEISLTECARRVGLPPSTALRLLRTMERADFVVRGTRGSFRAGVRLIQIGATALGQQSLVAVAEPSLRRLVDVTGESAYVSVFGPGDTALYVGMVEGTYAVRHTSWVGRTVPLEGTAVGAALRGEVTEAGYVARRSVVEPDVAAVAAPIRYPGGVAGALSVVGPTYRITPSEQQELGAIVRREAALVASRFAMNESDHAGTAATTPRRRRRDAHREPTR